MIRSSSLVMVMVMVVVTVMVMGGSAAHAQNNQADIAVGLNEEGKKLLLEDKPSEAAAKFEDAAKRSPEAKYFYNLCAARLQEGKFDDALAACKAVDLHNPSDAQKTNTGKLIGRINEEAKAQNVELHPADTCGTPPCPPAPDGTHPTTTNTDPNGTAPRPLVRPAVGRRLGQNLAMAGTPDNQYTWTLGVEGFLGGGRVGQADAYGSVVTGGRIKGDYMLAPASRLGMQLYLQYSHLGQGKNDNQFALQLEIVDIGLAGYKHFCLGSQSRACVTPLVGAHIALMSPEGSQDSTGGQLFNYLAVGGRAEVAFAYAFGTQFEHVVSLIGGANLYSQVLQGPSASDGTNSLSIREAGLDAGGVVAYIGVGYTYRFNTPLGSAPFVTLE